MRKFLCLFLVSFQIFAGEGNGSSGGGNVFGNRINPWFLWNTKEVQYCIELVPEFGRVTPERAAEVIADAFTYWKKTFKEHEGINFSYDFEFGGSLGDQNFILVEKCTEKTDIKFQLGFLTEEQRKIHNNYKHLLGLASRTSYDEENLRGKGYIYIAPEEGPLKPIAPLRLKNSWSNFNNEALKWALIHEIGHVFGLQDDHYSDNGLMGAKFVEQVARARQLKNAQPDLPFGCNQGYEGSVVSHYDSRTIEAQSEHLKMLQNKSDELRTYLGLEDKIKVSYLSNKRRIALMVNGKNWGIIQLKEGGAEYHYDPAISVYLTRKQKVIPKLSQQAYNRYLTLYFVKKSIIRKDEVLELTDGKKINVVMNFDQSCIPDIGTVYKGKFYSDLFSSY